MNSFKDVAANLATDQADSIIQGALGQINVWESNYFTVL
jgi:hypothetical protein